MKRIVLITSSFPFDKAREDSFLFPELEVLGEESKITIIPLRKSKKTYSIPEGIEVREDFAKLTATKFLMVFKVITNLWFWQFLLKEFFISFSKMSNFECLRELVTWAVYAFFLKKWIIRELLEKDNAVYDNKITFYSYWFTVGAVALALLKREKKNDIITLTRAHGFDLYEYRYKKNYIPFRKETLKMLDKIVFISKNGYNYMKNKYPSYKDKYELFPLGIRKSEKCSLMSSDNVFRIVSCSMLVPLKRVNLIAESIFFLGNYAKELKWEWTHIGDGPLIKELENYIRKECPLNVKVNLLGGLDNKLVMEYYQNNPVDVFVLLSETEGRPVSIMEALNFGLPIIATDVGGVSELVHNNDNGFLLLANIAPKEVAEKILFLRNNPEISKKMRERSREIFSKEADAISNYLRFRDFLLKL